MNLLRSTILSILMIAFLIGCESSTSASSDSSSSVASSSSSVVKSSSSSAKSSSSEAMSSSSSAKSSSSEAMSSSSSAKSSSSEAMSSSSSAKSSSSEAMSSSSSAKSSSSNAISSSSSSSIVYSTIKDARDNQTYRIVTIGSQTWMAENLKYLPSVVGPETGSQTTPHYYVYGYNGTNVTDAKATDNYNTYGVLYNWHAVNTGKLCPTGWHVPSDAEWTELTDYLGENAGGKLKATGTIEAGTGLWYDPNTGATNETGFTALPGGYCSSDGSFYYVGDYGYWWSASEGNTGYAWGRSVYYSGSDVYRNGYDKELGFSVRCLRD